MVDALALFLFGGTRDNLRRVAHRRLLFREKEQRSHGIRDKYRAAAAVMFNKCARDLTLTEYKCATAIMGAHGKRPNVTPNDGCRLVRDTTAHKNCIECHGKGYTLCPGTGSRDACERCDQTPQNGEPTMDATMNKTETEVRKPVGYALSLTTRRDKADRFLLFPHSDHTTTLARAKVFPSLISLVKGTSGLNKSWLNSLTVETVYERSITTVTKALETVAWSQQTDGEDDYTITYE